MTHHTRVARRFKAKSDNGKQYTVIEHQDYERILTGGNTVSEVDGLKRWVTTTGLLLNETNDTKVFTIVGTNETIREI
jgi:hypothetical protein